MSEDRRQKYARVLQHLRLDRPVFVQGDEITIHVTPRLNERCDLLARLVNKESGRTHAQTELMLSEETETIPLGKALNLPDGSYDIVLTPPLGEFHGDNPSERRLACAIAAGSHSGDYYGTAAERRSEALTAITGRSGPLAGLARRANGDTSSEGAAAEALVLGPAGLFTAFLVSQLSGNASGDLLDAMTQLGAADDGFLAATARSLAGSDEPDLADRLRDMGLKGFAGAEIPDDATSAALCALARCAPDDDAQALAIAVLDKLHLCLALRASNGMVTGGTANQTTVRLDRLSAFTRHAWGIGGFGSADAGLLALAASGYEAPAVIQAIALDKEIATNVERHRAGASDITHRMWRHCDAALIDTGTGIIQARLGADAIVTVSVDTIAITDDTAICRPNAPMSLPRWAFDTFTADGPTIIASAGDNYLALRSDAPFTSRPRDDGVGEDWRCGATLLVQLGRVSRDGPLDAFDARVATLSLTGDMATGLNGEAVDLNSPAPQPDEHIVSPFVTIDEADKAIEVRYGDHGLMISFA